MVHVSTMTVRLNSISDPPSVTVEGVGVRADPVSRVDPLRGVRTRRKPMWSISPAAVAREPATAGCRPARTSRSGSPPRCHRVGRCSARRVGVTARGTTTAGTRDWVVWSESSMPSIKPSVTSSRKLGGSDSPYKGTFGHHPLMAWCDNTGESLAFLLREGNAGSNTAADHIEVLTEAITQLPARYRRDLLITVDGAGASHDLVEHITTLDASPWRRVHYSIGWGATRGRAC